MPGDLSIVFNNRLTKTSFIGKYDYWLAPVASTAQLPASVLQASDTEIIAVNTGFLAGAGAAWVWCCWYDPVNKVRIGVKIDAGMQPLGAGNRPTWMVMADRSDQSVTPVWQPSGDDPAMPYSWDKVVTGLDITADSESTHETLHVAVLIEAIV